MRGAADGPDLLADPQADVACECPQCHGRSAHDPFRPCRPLQHQGRKPAYRCRLVQSGGQRMTALPRMAAKAVKAPFDTAAGCRIRADADLLASVSMLNANERMRMETSAASWSARAELLE